MIRKFNIDYFNFVKVSIIQIIIMVDYFRFFKVSFIQFIIVIVIVAITVITNY